MEAMGVRNGSAGSTRARPRALRGIGYGERRCSLADSAGALA